LNSKVGDEFKFITIDLWSSHSPWPFCNMPKSYFFLVKHPWLWRLNFRCSEPKFAHEFMFKARLNRLISTNYLSSFESQGYASIVSKRFQKAFSEYKPQLIVSVHPLMQHVPVSTVCEIIVSKCLISSKLKVLARAKVLKVLEHISFATVVTDLTRCHATWFHKVSCN